MNRSDFSKSISKGDKMKKFPKAGSKMKGAGAKKGSTGAGKVPPKPSPDMAPPMPFKKGGMVKRKGGC